MEFRGTLFSTIRPNLIADYKLRKGPNYQNRYINKANQEYTQIRRLKNSSP